VLTLLLEVGNLTRAAQILAVSQPTVSKMLARLRAHFGDPLFVRAGLAMHPTPKALALAQPLKELLATSARMRAGTASFDPATSTREFALILTEVGMITLLPPIIAALERQGRSLRVKAVPLDARQLEARLEAGEGDLALGAFPDASPGMRRQGLFADPYASVVRRGHKARHRLGKAEAFLAQRHVVVTSSSAGHAAHRMLEQVLGARLAPERVHARVPSFVASAFIASSTDAVATLPGRLAAWLAGALRLAVFAPPLALPRIEIGQLWHERVDHDEGHRWLRATIQALFGGPHGRGRAISENRQGAKTPR
jgi:DNA-binding transcriptional LysR family regulator